MRNGQNDLRQLIEQVRDGSEVASKDLVARYGTHILRIVRHKLNRSLRPKFDSQDFVQAVWASFFAMLPGRFTFEGPNELVAFLTELAQNKVVNEVRQRLMYQKHNVKREQRLGGYARTLPDHFDQPKPDEIAIAREELQRRLDGMPEHHQRIVDLLTAGRTRQEMADALGVSEKTVNRILQRLAPKAAHEPH